MEFNAWVSNLDRTSIMTFIEMRALSAIGFHLLNVEDACILLGGMDVRDGGQK